MLILDIFWVGGAVPLKESESDLLYITIFSRQHYQLLCKCYKSKHALNIQ